MPVEYEITIEADEADYHGNCMASGDDAVDRESEQWITDQLNSGNELAWCWIEVRASFEGFEGTDSLGGVSVRNRAELDELIKDHGMKENALASLCQNIEATVPRCEARIVAARAALKSLEEG